MSELLARVRIGIALGLLALAGVAQQFDMLADDVVIRVLVGGLLFGAAALIGEIAPRLRWGRLRALAGPLAEFWAAAITVALLERYSDAAPALMALPLSTLAITLAPIDVTAFAALAAALLIEARVLRTPRLESAAAAIAWAFVYVAWSIVAGRAGAALRRGTRRHERAEAALPTLAAASSYDEIARIVFDYLDHVVDGDDDAPAALLVDDDASGSLVTVASRALGAEARARLRAPAAHVTALPPPFTNGLIVHLRDGDRVVGLIALAGSASDTRESEEVVPLATAAVTRVRAASRARRLAPAGTGEAKAWLTGAVRDTLGPAEVRVVRARDARADFRDLVKAARRARIAAAGGRAAVQVGGDDLWLLIARDSMLSASDTQLLAALAEEAARLRERAGVETRVARLAARMNSLDNDTAARLIDALRLAIEANQPQLAGSGAQVAALADAIAARVGQSVMDREALHVAALLRDVGELGIDRAILDRPSELSTVDREVVERHPILGEAILGTLTFLAPAARIVRAHHERWNGSGYPDRLSGDDIPAGARVLAVADAYVAMTTPRPYRAALQPSEAAAILLEARGSHYDPAVVDALVHLAGTGALVLP